MPHAVSLAEPLIRLGAFFWGVRPDGALGSARPPSAPESWRRLRWPNNLGVVVVDTAVIRILFPTAAVGVAITAEEHRWGLFNLLPLPQWAAVALSVVLLDLAIYAQHFAFHATPVLWRLHCRRDFR